MGTGEGFACALLTFRLLPLLTLAFNNLLFNPCFLIKLLLRDVSFVR